MDELDDELPDVDDGLRDVDDDIDHCRCEQETTTTHRETEREFRQFWDFSEKLNRKSGKIRKKSKNSGIFLKNPELIPIFLEKSEKSEFIP